MLKINIVTAIILTLASLSSSDLVAQDQNNICLLSGMPPSEVKHTVIRKLKVGRHSFGSVNTVLPILFKKARSVNADAVINYNGSQRFGFWPWQLIRPIVTGTAVTWELPENVTCEGIGGTYKTQLTSSLTSDS